MNDTATTEIYTLSLHDALPISLAFRRRATLTSSFVLADHLLLNTSTPGSRAHGRRRLSRLTSKSLYRGGATWRPSRTRDRKSTRLNSSHANISYAVFCLTTKQS